MFFFAPKQGQFIIPESVKIVRFCVKQLKKFRIWQKIKLDQDTNYNVEIAVQNIHEYIKYLMRNSQQKKAKSEAFDILSESTGF